MESQKRNLESQKNNIYKEEDFQRDAIFKGILGYDGYGPSYGAKSGYGMYAQRKYGNTLGSLGATLNKINEELNLKYKVKESLEKVLKQQKNTLKEIENKIEEYQEKD